MKQAGAAAAGAETQAAAPAPVGDSLARSAVKGFIWRIFSTTATLSIALFILKDAVKMEDYLQFGAAEFASKYVLFFLHERLWTLIRFI